MASELAKLGDRLVGNWTTQATHPYLPGADIAGSATFEWLDGERFVVFRAHYDHPDIPDSVAVIGDIDGFHMHYFDSRGVYRVYELTIVDNGWVIAMGREAPKSSFASPDSFSQRIAYSFEDAGRTISGKGRLS